MRTLGLALLIAGVPSLVSAAPAVEPAARPVELEVVSMVGGDDSDDIEQRIRAQTSRQLARNEVAAAPTSPIRLTIDVRWRDDARTTYAVRVVLAANGEVLAEEQQSCELCSTAELFDRISFSVARAMPAIRGRPRRAPPHPKPTPPPAQTSAGDPGEVPGRRTLTVVGWAGVGLGATGVVAIAAGSPLWAKGKTTRLSPEDATVLETRDYRPPGIALTTVGASFVAAGVVMIAVDVARQQQSQWALLPHVDRRSAGITLRARF